MKPFLCLFSLVLCVFSQQSARAEEPYRLTVHQQSLLDSIVEQFGSILRESNSANSCDIPLDAPDPLAQSFSDSFDEGLGGTLYLSNTVIDGLSKLTDQPEITTNKMEIRVKAKLKELNIHGDYNLEGYNGEDETGTFSVVLSSVAVLGVVSLIEDPHGNVKINKVTPTILSEYSYVTMKSDIVSHGPMLRLVQKHVENTIRYRLIRLATMEVLFQYPAVPDDGLGTQEIKPLNRTLFEARKYVDYGFNPYKMKMMSMKGQQSTSIWHMGPFNIHGFSNFFVDELDLMVTNNGTTIDIICRVIGSDLYGKFPLTLQQRNIGDYTVEKVEAIAKLVLLTNGKSPIRLVTMQMQMTHCVTHIRDQATGQSINEAEFGFDIEGLFCLLLKNDLSMPDIVAHIQTEILNRMDITKLKSKIENVVMEDYDSFRYR